MSSAQRLGITIEAEREVQMALEELDVMWEELQGQAALLARETERYAEFFDYAPDAYVITDAGGNVREANRAARELLGEALEVQFSVRNIPLRKSGVAGVCWLIRPQ